MLKSVEPINFTTLNSVNSEALKYLQENAIKACVCKCSSRGVSTNHTNELAVGQFSDSTVSSSSSIASSAICNNENNPKNSAHRPSVEFLVKCNNLAQELFDIDCFHGIPTALNDVYYKLGQLNNFKKNIQNVFAPSNLLLIRVNLNAKTKLLYNLHINR